MESDFDLFIGVDQTGAVRKGRGGVRAPVPLKAVAISEGRAKAVKLDSLSRRELQERVLAPLGRTLDSSVALILDCVFGLAAEARPGDEPGGDSLWSLLRSAEGLEYGRVAGEGFFEAIRARAGLEARIPIRACEKIAGANSVFVPRPYQRNVQTGTFRIWKDLVRDAPARWLNFWSIDDKKSSLPAAPWVFEGYPSWMWRRVFGVPTRQPAKMASLLKVFKIDRKDLELLCADPDWADSAVLALGGLRLQQEGRMVEPAPGFTARRPGGGVEGWILGVPDK